MNGLHYAIEYVSSGLSKFPEGSLRVVLISMLGFTFLWSGYAKARSPWSAAFAAVDFGVTDRPSLRLAWVVTSGEIALGAALAITPVSSSGFAIAAAAVAGCTLLVFSALIARALSASQKFDCACFGNGEGLTRRTLMRSGTLAIAALACASAGPLSPPLGVEGLLSAWCAAAGILAIPVLLARAQMLVGLWRTSLEAIR